MISRPPRLKMRMVGPKGRKRPVSCGVFPRRALDAFYMRKALEQARLAASLGEVPVGCVIVSRGTVICATHNLVEEERSALRHAELLALDLASERLDWRLNEATLYVTLEPCAMCAGAAINARLGRIVFGAYDPDRGACGSMVDLLSMPRQFQRVRATGGVLEKECAEVLRRFFRERRKRSASADESAV